MKPSVVVPALPSATATSSIESVGAASSLVIVPVPWPSRIVALVGAREVDDEGLVGLDSTSPLTVHGDGLGRAPAAKVSVPEAASVVAVRRVAVPLAVA